MDLQALDAPIDTVRYRLRLLDESDLDDLHAVHGDDEVTRFIPSPTWNSRDDARAWLARNVAYHAEGRQRRWAVIERATGRRVGDCMLFAFDAAAARAEIGFVLGRRDWGNGTMREVAQGLIARAFGEAGLRRLDAHVDPRNVASHRLLLALGFVHEGLLRQRSVLKGEAVDSNVYGLLRDEWHPVVIPAQAGAR